MIRKIKIISGIVTGKREERFIHRWYGLLRVEGNGTTYTLKLAGNIAQWLKTSEKVEIVIEEKAYRSLKRRKQKILEFNEYELYKILDGNEKIKIWPCWSKEYDIPRYSPVTGEELYRYHIVAREAMYESDYEAIAELEQYHYASEKELVALWKCEKCGNIIEANVKPICEKCKTDEHVHILEIKGSTPASRFLVLELKDRKPYEPKIVAYVRVDPPIPLMHRRLPNGDIEYNIREKVFPREWFHPVFSPEQKLKELLRTLMRQKGRRIARNIVWNEARWQAIEESNTAAARIARVVVHPDYRSDGLGQLAVKAAIEWINERRVPEMRKRKHLVETIAQMARFNPFFEKVGFKYLWETKSGRPVLYYPLTDEGRRYIEEFLEKDPYAKVHKGKLCVPTYGPVDKISSSIILKNVTKGYSNLLNIKGLRPEIRDVLIAFGVKSRVIQREVLRNVTLTIDPGEIVCVVGVSGAGKTTLLRLIVGAILKLRDERYLPDHGIIEVPTNARVGVLIPGELEPEFGNESILEHVYRKCKNIYMAVEILNKCGLSDAVLYRARYQELSTGQKERAKIASILAERPNVLIIDELGSNLDTLTATRVAKKLGEICRNAGITVIAVTHRAEVMKALSPNKIIYVGYGTCYYEKRCSSSQL
ncbi:MAG: GNAT family N-acetyltransferase [Euryarchaeota archaeon]|nr:GNAT family N-acetyltransferase [Euryarchaeota archaeon]